MPKSFLSVRQFGAKGCGNADDTAALNACYAACVALRAPMFLPAGTYLVRLTQGPRVFTTKTVLMP